MADDPGPVIDPLELRSADVDDVRLLEAYRAGDVDAFGELYRRHVADASAFARSLVGPHADDVVAESFTKILRALRAGRGPTESFAPYLMTTVRSVANTHHGRAARTQPMPPEELESGPAPDGVGLFHDAEAVREAYLSLPERQREVLWLLEAEQRAPAEIAERYELSLTAVSSIAHRAREGLRDAYLRTYMPRWPTRDRDCREARKMVPAYHRDRLAPPDRDFVEAHLDDCDRCSGLYLDFASVAPRLAVILIGLGLRPGSLGEDDGDDDRRKAAAAALLGGGAGAAAFLASGAAAAASAGAGDGGEAGTPPPGSQSDADDDAVRDADHDEHGKLADEDGSDRGRGGAGRAGDDAGPGDAGATSGLGSAGGGVRAGAGAGDAGPRPDGAAGTGGDRLPQGSGEGASDDPEDDRRRKVGGALLGGIAGAASVGRPAAAAQEGAGGATSAAASAAEPASSPEEPNADAPTPPDGSDAVPPGSAERRSSGAGAPAAVADQPATAGAAGGTTRPAGTAGASGVAADMAGTAGASSAADMAAASRTALAGDDGADGDDGGDGRRAAASATGAGADERGADPARKRRLLIVALLLLLLLLGSTAAALVARSGGGTSRTPSASTPGDRRAPVGSTSGPTTRTSRPTGTSSPSDTSTTVGGGTTTTVAGRTTTSGPTGPGASVAVPTTIGGPVTVPIVTLPGAAPITASNAVVVGNAVVGKAAFAVLTSTAPQAQRLSLTLNSADPILSASASNGGTCSLGPPLSCSVPTDPNGVAQVVVKVAPSPNPISLSGQWVAVGRKSRLSTPATLQQARQATGAAPDDVTPTDEHLLVAGTRLVDCPRTAGVCDDPTEPAVVARPSAPLHVQVPNGAVLTGVRLYWAADTSAGTGGTAASDPAARNHLTLQTPSGVTRQLTATKVVQNGTRYQAVADVTGLITGSGTYTVRGMQIGTGANRFAAVTAVLAYRFPGATVGTRTPSVIYTPLRWTQLSETVDIDLARPAGRGTVGLDIVAYDGDPTADELHWAGQTWVDPFDGTNDPPTNDGGFGSEHDHYVGSRSGSQVVEVVAIHDRIGIGIVVLDDE